MPASLKELAQDGYIFVIQNLRGRFRSEGVFELTSQVDLSNPKATNETTDAYDSIEWLVKNVPNNSGKVGMYGVSYDGLTTALTLLHPHPALAAISEQASPVDQWMNDDDHRYGALRESYDFEYAVMEQADKNSNTHFDFETYDTYQWYLDLGPLSNINAKYLHGKIPYWNSTIDHPDYDDFWKKEAWVRQLHASTVPNLNVAGFWDQEDPWGPWQIFRHAEEHDPDHTNFIVAGPWFHGQWQGPKGEGIGLIPSAKTSKPRFSDITCTEKARSRIGRPPHSRVARTVGIVTRFGRRRRRRPQIYICTPMARCPLLRRPQGKGPRRIANMFLIPPIRYRTVSGRFHRRIQRGIGGRGKWRISVLWITGRMCCLS